MRYTKTSLGSNYASKQQIDSNLDDIKTAIDDTLSRKGDSPNAMEADLDMNSNQILNLPDAVLPQEPITLSQFNAQSVGTKTTQTLKQKHVATAGQTVFTTPAYVIGSNNLSVYINGVRQDGAAYSETTTTSITLTEGAELSDIVEVLVNELPTSTDQVGAANVTYDGSTVAARLDDMKHYDTVALAKADTGLAIGAKVKTWGYTTLGDGGGAEYEVVAGGTGTDDGGSYHDMSNGNQLELIHSGKVKVEQFGVVGDGVTDCSAEIQASINSGLDIVFGDKTYRANNLTQSTGYQQLIGIGAAIIQKNANGDLLTSTGDYFKTVNMQFRGESSSPSFTGHNLVLNGNHATLLSSGSRWAFGRAVKATGEHLQIIGTNDIYQTTDSSSSGYDIEVDGGASPTLYHQLSGVYTSQSAGGILLINTGTSSIRGGQFGKLTVQTGSGGGGSSGPYVTACRINGDVTIEQSNTVMGSMTISADVTIGDGSNAYSGIVFDKSCNMQSGQTLTINDLIRESVIDTEQLINITITDNLTDSTDIDNSISIKPTAFTPTWEGSVTDPAIGDGTLTGRYSRNGRRYTVNISLQIGSSTTFGSGEWRFGLPDLNTPIDRAVGSSRLLDNGSLFYIAVSYINSGSNYILVQPEQANSVRSNSPFTWANTDTLELTIEYDV